MSNKGREAEELVNQKLAKFFLQYWYYPNPFDLNDSSKKEIADFLILFHDVCIIGSIKNSSFDDKNPDRFNKKIKKGINQIQGAERKLFDTKRSVLLEHPINKNTINFNCKQYSIIIRLLVDAAGETESYKPLEKIKKGIVHVIHQTIFASLFEELDTISDTVEYFKEREKFFSGGLNPVPLLGASELDLLGFYLQNDRSFDKILELKKDIIVLPNFWEDWQKDKQNLARKEENKISYFIDKLVKKDILSSSLPNAYQLAEHLMSYNRFERRCISECFWDFVNSKAMNRKFTEDCVSPEKRYLASHPCAFVFLYFYEEKLDEKCFDDIVQWAVEGFSIVMNYAPRTIFIIGSNQIRKQFIYDLCDVKKFSKEEEKKKMIFFQEKLGWFKNIERSGVCLNEYPDTDSEN